MFNPRTKKLSTITFNEDMKGNAKCKNSRFEPPFGGLRGNAQVSSMAWWKAHCRLPISDNWTFFASFHVTAEALVEIGVFWRVEWVNRTNPDDRFTVLQTLFLVE